jgi:hypothetical protein
LPATFKEKVSDVAGSIADGISETYEAAKEGAVDLLEQEKQKANMSSGTLHTKVLQVLIIGRN